MTIKQIMTFVEGLPQDKTALDTAHQLATTFNASLDVLHIQMDGRDTIPLIGQGMSAPVVEQIITSLEAEGSVIKKRAIKTTKDFCAQHHMQFVHYPAESQSKETISWQEKLGRASEILPEEARLCDLTIISQISAADDDMTRLTTEETVLESGRLVLLATEDIPTKIGSHIMFYWNGSRESARLLDAGLPFFKQAKEITFIVADSEDHMGPEGARAIQALKRHHIQANLLSLEDHADRLAECILDKAIEIKADLLMMGGYTHSKLRQWVMGSMTDYVIQNTTIPLLLIH